MSSHMRTNHSFIQSSDSCLNASKIVENTGMNVIIVFYAAPKFAIQQKNPIKPLPKSS